MKKVASYALGCKVNQYESEAIAELFAQKGYEIVSVEDWADIYIINTCTVTNFGDKKSRQLIRKVKRQNPDAVVAVVGCYAQTAPEEMERVEGVNLILGTKDKGKIAELVEQYRKEEGIRNYVTDIRNEHVFEPLSIQKLAGRTRAYLKIQDGCNRYCSYCIIPYARGPIRSRDPEDVVAEVKRLAENGFQEVVLTGIHVASYGKDLGNMDLLGMIRRVHAVEGIQRIRLSSIEPNIVTEDFIEGIRTLPKLCDHYHLSLQSGCDETLRQMNRHYDTADYRKAAQMLREALPDVALTTDIIVGFPGETEEHFQQSAAFAKEIGFSKIHVFPYSPKRGTPAAKRKDQNSNEVKADRSHRLIQVSDALGNAFLEQRMGQVYEVLFEREVEEGIYEGHTTNYIKVRTKSAKNISNEILRVKLVRHEQECAWGCLLEENVVKL